MKTTSAFLALAALAHPFPSDAFNSKGASGSLSAETAGQQLAGHRGASVSKLELGIRNVHNAIASWTPHGSVSLSGIEHTLTTLVSDSTDEPPSETCTEMTSNISKMLTDALLPSIDEAKQRQVSRVKLLADTMKNCSLAKTEGLEAIEKVPDAVSTLGNTHLQCRKRLEPIAEDGHLCEGNLAVMKIHKEEVCATKQAYRSSQKDALEDCKVEDLEGLESYLLSKKTFYNSQYKHYSELSHNCTQLTLDISAKELECETYKNATAALEVCNEDQRKFEVAYCQHVSGYEDVCETYTQCYDGVKNNTNAGRETARKEGLTLVKQWQEMKRIQCLVEVLQKDDALKETHTKACTNKVWDGSHLAVAYYSLTAKETCGVSDVDPCGQPFKDEYYPGVTPAACTPCPGISEA